MRLSPTTGKGLMGQGSGTISIDGVTPASLAAATGGGWDWLDDTTCGGQAQGIIAGGFRLYQLVLPNTLTILDAAYNGGADVAQQFRAGNGEWARFVAGGGVRTSTGLGLTLPLAALGDMDADGLLAVVQNYAGDNGLVTYAANGSTLQTVSTSVLAGTQRMRMHDAVVAYQETNLNWHLRDAATGALKAFAPRTDAVIANMVPVTIDGTIWVVEVSATAITLRPAVSSNGYVLSTSANIFFPDAVSLSAGTVRVGWSVNSGESPTAMRLADVTLSSGDFVSGSTSTGSLVLTPEDPLPPDDLPVGPVEGGDALLARKQPRHAIKEDAFVGGATGKRVYQRWWELVAESASVNLSSGNVTGTLPPDMGGTGTTTGLAVLNGQNTIQDTTQLDTAQSFGPFVLATGRSQVLASPTAIDDYIQLDGTAELVVI